MRVIVVMAVVVVCVVDAMGIGSDFNMRLRPFGEDGKNCASW